jgi:hypothetical protein
MAWYEWGDTVNTALSSGDRQMFPNGFSNLVDGRWFDAPQGMGAGLSYDWSKPIHIRVDTETAGLGDEETRYMNYFVHDTTGPKPDLTAYPWYRRHTIMWYFSGAIDYDRGNLIVGTGSLKFSYTTPPMRTRPFKRSVLCHGIRSL